ncbi:CLUMA_CG011740, isoform A [Clunio marinus]|uniref:CLUMA_CG011740, isoform A n=1 Tax=Clunio marinus TaxID=568069 RepID=A0A1J1IDP4_9DIPT|nr:CLUMA_CG011740, isoform A [Clunio marinus]
MCNGKVEQITTFFSILNLFILSGLGLCTLTSPDNDNDTRRTSVKKIPIKLSRCFFGREDNKAKGCRFEIIMTMSKNANFECFSFSWFTRNICIRLIA